MIFQHFEIDFDTWCKNIVSVSEWATSMDILLFSYVTKWNVIVVGNYLNGLLANSNQLYLTHILKMQLNILTNGTIHILFHKFGQPLDKITNGNHFAYLKPLSKPPFIIGVNSIIQQKIEMIIIPGKMCVHSTRKQYQSSGK